MYRDLEREVKEAEPNKTRKGTGTEGSSRRCSSMGSNSSIDGSDG